MVKSRKFRRSVKGKKSKKTRSSIKRRMTRRKLRKSRSVRRGGDSGPPCYNNKGELDIAGYFNEGGYLKNKPGNNFRPGCPPSDIVRKQIEQANLNEIEKNRQQREKERAEATKAIAEQEARRKEAYATQQREIAEDTRTDQEKIDAAYWTTTKSERPLTEQEKLDKMYWRNEYPEMEQTRRQGTGMSWGERKGLGGKGRRRRQRR